MTPEEQQRNREKFVSLLQSTGRAGVDRVVAGLDELGFFAAPASTRFHLNEPGGLAKHSLNVYAEAVATALVQSRICPGVEARLGEDSLKIAALLHDVCKADVYREEVKHRKRPDGRWEDYTGYTSDYSAFPFGHGEKSVIRLLRWGLEMTDDEMLAIRWHMHAWAMADYADERGSFNAASLSCPLLAVLIAADGLATRLLESDSAPAPAK